MAKKTVEKTYKIVMKVLNGLVLIFLIFGLAATFGMYWLFRQFPNVRMDELLYQISAPIRGTNMDLIIDFCLTVLLPVVGIFAICAIILHYMKTKGRRICRAVYIAASAALVAFSSSVVWNRLDVNAYMLANSEENKMFIENNYVDPANKKISFPEQKRNLLFVYLESMETTFASKDVGGAFDENLIPEITQLALENENFSGGHTVLNGPTALAGSTWTVGSMFSSSSGLPLKISLSNRNSMNKQSQFFETTVTLGDILKDNGYSNTLLVGSDAEFGGRKLYYETHGDYEIMDLYTQRAAHKLPTDDYKVWWGYEDMYLYQFAQEKLTELGQQDEPFNMTMLTVDTHKENGYKCSLCGNEHPDNQYADVYSCASKQLIRFIDWCKEQPWYENTTIVITGDHPTMDVDFCKDISHDYNRKVYMTILNSPTENKAPTRYREFSTFDTFPTTIAALGATIEGERLGLGTNLYSGLDTLTEQLGVKEENAKLMADSKFMEERANLDDPDD